MSGCHEEISNARECQGDASFTYPAGGNIWKQAGADGSGRNQTEATGSGWKRPEVTVSGRKWPYAGGSGHTQAEVAVHSRKCLERNSLNRKCIPVNCLHTSRRLFVVSTPSIDSVWSSYLT